MKIDVLNCVNGQSGFVRLVKSTGNDLDIVRAARVSYDADWRTGEDEGADRKLIRYLLKNHHTSPFEHVTFTFEVKAPIFVIRQWHRHRTWSYNEISARYTELDEGYYVPRVEHITTQHTDNKQMRTMIQHPEAESIQNMIDHSCISSFAVYRNLIATGAPRELARGVLPLNAYSRMFATVDLHNFMGFIRLRLHSHSQYEIRVYAEAMSKLVAEQVPVTMGAFFELLEKK
jgi:thymidylate synthase (FAD)